LKLGRRSENGPSPLRLAREGRLAWGIFNRLFVQGRVPSLWPVDLSAHLSGAPALRCRPETRGKFSEYFSPAEVAEIRRHDLDFILRFAFGIVRGDILSAARHGVWSFHDGDPDRSEGPRPAFGRSPKGTPSRAPCCSASPSGPMAAWSSRGAGSRRSATPTRRTSTSSSSAAQTGRRASAATSAMARRTIWTPRRSGRRLPYASRPARARWRPPDGP
jgi:hypothetical protein